MTGADEWNDMYGRKERHVKEIGELTLTADKDYTDYQWWLGRTADGGWEIVTFGYGY